MLLQVILPRKPVFAFPCAAGFGTINPRCFREMHRDEMSVEICRAAEAALATRIQAGEPASGSDRKKSDVNPLFLHFLEIAIECLLMGKLLERVNHSPSTVFLAIVIRRF